MHSGRCQEMLLDHRTRCGRVACASRASQPSILDYAEHQHEEHQNDQRKRQHHPHALEVAPLYLLVVRLDIHLTVLRALPYRPQLTVTIAGRRLIQLALWRLERVDLRVRIVADSLKALGKARRVLDVVLALCRSENARHARRPACGMDATLGICRRSRTSSLSLYAIAQAVWIESECGRWSVHDQARR